MGFMVYLNQRLYVFEIKNVFRHVAYKCVINQLGLIVFFIEGMCLNQDSFVCVFECSESSECGLSLAATKQPETGSQQSLSSINHEDNRKELI